jgi:D-alanyl-D-alanine carboxypeptidase
MKRLGKKSVVGLGLITALTFGFVTVTQAWRLPWLIKLGYWTAQTGTDLRMISRATSSISVVTDTQRWASKDTKNTGPNHHFRTGSVTKTYVAAAMLRLMEGGTITLDDPITKHLPPDLDGLLRADGYSTNAITIGMLLNHTSGIADFFSMPGWVHDMTVNPTKVWTAAEQIAVTTRSLDPLAQPGTAFSYSDTGYVLAGIIIEQVTGQSLDLALAELLKLRALGLVNTQIERTLSTATPKAQQVLNGVDGWTIHPSVDAFGAGGITTTSADLSRFFALLADGKVFDQPDTLTLMLTPSPESLRHDLDGYGFGVSLATVRGHKCFGHGGFWGVLALACPGTGVAAAGMVTDPSGQAALKDQIGASVWVSLGGK